MRAVTPSARKSGESNVLWAVDEYKKKIDCTFLFDYERVGVSVDGWFS